MYITAHINAALASIICVSWCTQGKEERKGANWGKRTSTLMLYSSILRRRRRSKKEGVQGEKEIVQGVCSQNDGKKAGWKMKGVSRLLDAKMSCYESMMQML